VIQDAAHLLRLVREMLESPEEAHRLTGLPTDERRVLRTLAAIWGFEPGETEVQFHAVMYDKFQHGMAPHK
jgi:hypothetical protein